MKIVTKSGCTRCVQIKEYMKGNGIAYEEIYIEKPEQLDVYRQMLTDAGRGAGFPILLEGSEIINGSTEELIEFLSAQSQRPKSDSIYDWGF